MGHRNARLTPLGRATLVQRVLVERWPVATAAESMGVSRATAHKWVDRYRSEGPAGLLDRSSRPHRCPAALSPRQVARILEARRRLRHGPHRLAWHLGHPRSTIYAVLRREGLPRLSHLDRPTGAPVRRYERERPGELLHIDVKKLGRIPPGGGHRIHGRGPRTGADRRRRLGYDYLHVAVDDRSRVAYIEVHPDERGATVARFLTRTVAFFGARGVRVEAVMTDNAWCYTKAPAFRRALFTAQVRHLLTPPRRPQVNGKVERFHRILVEEWAYARLYRSNGARLRTLSRWLDFYNSRRPHTALGGRPPASAL